MSFSTSRSRVDYGLPRAEVRRANKLKGPDVAMKSASLMTRPTLESIYQATEAMVPALRERLSDIDYVDLRFDERLYVRPAKALHAKK